MIWGIEKFILFKSLFGMGRRKEVVVIGGNRVKGEVLFFYCFGMIESGKDLRVYMLMEKI